ncbi:hypothetical protein FB451DRAFT_1252983 [Mycena latifolia]|nr:hypothetical protein FB451DRAFT_1252983 [Mycena latifolia]
MTVYEQWDKFLTLAKERLDVFHSYNSGQYPSMRACDNMKCCKIGVKSGFKYCNACRSVYYCSETCQFVDWLEGGHCVACSSWNSLSTETMICDSRRAKDLLCAPFKASRLSKIDYSQGHKKVNIQPLSSAPTKQRLNGAEWENIVSRVARSGGYTRLDVIVMPGAEEPWY